MNGRELSETRFARLFLLLRLAGIPLYMKNVSIFFKAYSYLSFACMLSTAVTGLIALVTISNNLKLFMQNIRATFGFLGVTVGHIFIRFFIDRVEYLISLTEQFTWEEQPKSEDFRMTSWISRVQNIAKNTCVVVILFHTIQSGVRVLMLGDLIFDIWFPFDPSKSPTYEIIIFFQAFITLSIIGTFAGYLALNCILMAVACSQLEKLALQLRNLKQDQDVELQLINWIQYHQKTLRFVKAIEDKFSTYFLVQMIPLFLGPCVFAFSAITSWGDFTDQSQAFISIVLFIGQASIFCWFGTQLTESAENVKRAAWEWDWIGAPIKIQKTILFIIARGNKDVVITAGKFVPLSNVTLMLMIKHCISLFMFLLNVKDRKL